jgi:exodeoxyribonuclease VII small subunit
VTTKATKQTDGPADEGKGETPDFERTMRELEETVRRLEAGDLPLEDSLAAFEKGIALVRTLHARLDAVQSKIEELTQQSDGSVSRTPFAAGSKRSPAAGDAEHSAADKRGNGDKDDEVLD